MNYTICTIGLIYSSLSWWLILPPGLPGLPESIQAANAAMDGRL